MNPLRTIYPLWLREKLYFHMVSRIALWPNAEKAMPLEFAPATLPSLLQTDCGHRQIAWLGFYERELTTTLSRLARRGGLLVDVGANVGYFSILWVALNVKNRAYAFEPSPRNLTMLRANVAAQMHPERIQICEYALGRESGEMPFDPGPDDQSGWGGFKRSISRQTIRVRVQRLDELLPPAAIVDCVKIDTEGADAWVIEGATKLLREKRIRHVLFEENSQRMQALGISPRTAERLLSDLGYVVSPLGKAGSCTEFHAWPGGR